MEPYRILNPGETRILILRPGVYGAPLDSSLDIVSLNTLTYEQGYEAVSYAWGPRVLDHELHVENIGKIAITKTLYQALQRLRPPDTHRRLWVDAISINQDSTAERSSQVAMMGQIFSSAFSVLIWLGESNPEDALVFATINLCRPFHEEIELDLTGGERIDMDDAATASLDRIDAQLVESAHCPCCGTFFTPTQNTAKDGLRAAKKLLHRSWFARLWVVQEVVLGARAYIISGSHRAEWQCFSSAMFRLVTSEQRSSDSQQNGPSREGWFESAFAQIRHFESFGFQEQLGGINGASLLGSILELSARDCYEPRDRVYAIRSINGLEGGDDFQPNYDIELSDLYRSVVVRALTDKSWRQPFNPDVSLVLALAGTEDAATAELQRPSWVPHFHHLSKRSRAKSRTYDFKGATHDPQFVTTSYGLICRWLPETPETLVLKGRCFGVVNDILTDSLCPREYPEDESGSATEWSDTVLALVQWYLCCSKWIRQRSKELIDLELLLCAGDHRSWDGDSRAQLDMEKFREICSTLSLSETLLVEAWRTLRPFLMYEPNARVDRGRRLASFDIGGKLHFGWAPPQASIGDSVCIIPGAPWPFAIREFGDGSYMLLGDVYVEGVDAFEALDCRGSGPQPMSWRVSGAKSLDAIGDERRDEDPFRSLNGGEYRKSAARLDAVVESLGWVTLR